MRAALLQFGLLLFFSLFLDFGVLCQACSFSSVTFWLGTIIILIRRRGNPTAGDLTYLRWGLLVINLIGVPAFVTVWRLKGLIR
jgi:hypothetical protein